MKKLFKFWGFNPFGLMNCSSSERDSLNQYFKEDGKGKNGEVLGNIDWFIPISERKERPYCDQQSHLYSSDYRQMDKG